MNKMYYYIFGSVAGEYIALDYPDFIQSCKENTDWVLHKHKHGDNPNSLLSAFHGYENFSEIPEETYNILERILHVRNSR